MAVEKGRPGRPRHQPTAEQRSAVARMVAEDKPVVEIARIIGVAESTLRRYYVAELGLDRPQGVLPCLPPADPQPPRPFSGRPPHTVSDETRERVEVLAASRMPAWQIARALGISEPTLRQHYAEELDGGRARKTARMVEALYTAGVGGNVSAAKEWLRQFGELEDPPPPPVDDAQPMGKKEAAHFAALSAADGTEWGALLPH